MGGFRFGAGFNPPEQYAVYQINHVPKHACSAHGSLCKLRTFSLRMRMIDWVFDRNFLRAGRGPCRSVDCGFAVIIMRREAILNQVVF